MKALTIEHVLENNFTPIDCIKYFNPDWNDVECDIYLWEQTCFPFSIETMIKQLNDYETEIRRQSKN
ncbi:MAG: hypothetical protein RL308_2894 [Bacteroidota bacterium]|jgi:hypothetical protein